MVYVICFEEVKLIDLNTVNFMIIQSERFYQWPIFNSNGKSLQKMLRARFTILKNDNVTFLLPSTSNSSNLDGIVVVTIAARLIAFVIWTRKYRSFCIRNIASKQAGQSYFAITIEMSYFISRWSLTRRLFVFLR